MSKGYKRISSGKNKAVVLVLISIGVLVIASYISNQKNIINKEIKLTYDDKQYLIDISKKAIKQYIEEGTQYSVDAVQKNFLFNTTVIVSLYIDGINKGIGSAAGNNVADSVIEAAINALKDGKFEKIKSTDDLGKVDILISIIKDAVELENRDVVYLSENINLGVDGLYLNKDSRSVYILPSIAIQQDWNQVQMLQNLCLQAKIEINCWKSNNISLYKYDSINFISRQNNIFDIYRGSPLIGQELVDKEKIYKSLVSASDWQLNIQKNDGSYTYLFNPSAQQYPNSNSLIRQALGAYSMAQSYRLTGKADYLQSAERNIDFVLTYSKEEGDFAYLSFNDNSELGTVAVTMLAMLELPDYKKYEREIGLFSNFLLLMQRNDGSFKTFYKNDYPDDFDFYPGETLLALTKLYNKTGDKRYLEAVEKAFPFYKAYFSRTKHASFVMWQTSAFSGMYEITKKKEYADFVFEMSDWIIKSQYNENAASYPDFLGGFSLAHEIPDAGTPVFVEGLADAYKTAKSANDRNKIIKYGKSLKLATRFILQLQFDDANTYYIENPETAVGAIRGSLVSNSLRIDYTAHAISALSRVYRIYDEIKEI